MDLDTAPGPAARYRELIGALDGPRRLEMAARLSTGARDLAAAGLRHRHPAAPEREIHCRLAALLYGRAAAERLFGAVPDDAP